MGSRLTDAEPGRAAGLPLAIAALAIIVVVLVLVLRARHARRTTKPQGDGQLDEGSGGQ
jgi:membrane protein implicated in regulation of membrane protease activity